MTDLNPDLIERANRARMENLRGKPLADHEYRALRSQVEVDALTAALEAAAPTIAAAERDRLAAAIERVQKLADDWHSRGEHLMAYSKTLPDEISDALLESGAEFVERARLLRIALADPDGCMTTTEGDLTC